MASFCRLVRFSHLKRCTTLVRNITSTSSPIQQSLIKPGVLVNNHWIWQQNEKIDSPLISRLQIDLPNGLKYVPLIENPGAPKNLELPPTEGGDAPKEAARLIVIRRNKMKRHKLKKLRIRMKFEWARRRQKRELAKEKAFQAILINQCKQGEAFSAERYIEDRLAKFNEITANLSKQQDRTK